MKKSILIISGLALLATLSFSSCKKCTTCSYSGINVGEVCGKPSEIKDYKSQMEAIGYKCD